MASAPDDPTRLGVPPERPSDAEADGETRLAPTSRPPTHSSAPGKSVGSSSGWLSSSGSSRFGLLATMAALITHFILLRAPLTTELGTWRGPLGLWFLGTVAVLGLGACYLARSGSASVPVQTYAEAQAI